jgi:hypothetical protein
MKSEWAKNEDRTISFIKMHLDLGKTEIEVPADVFAIIKHIMLGSRMLKYNKLITWKITP